MSVLWDVTEIHFCEKWRRAECLFLVEGMGSEKGPRSLCSLVPRPGVQPAADQPCPARDGSVCWWAAVRYEITTQRATGREKRPRQAPVGGRSVGGSETGVSRASAAGAGGALVGSGTAWHSRCRPGGHEAACVAARGKDQGVTGAKSWGDQPLALPRMALVYTCCPGVTPGYS